jgi:predicted membrane protein
MEKINNLEPTEKKRVNEPSGRLWVGLGFIIIGSFLLAERSGLDLPHWLFSWKMVLIVVGFFVGARRGFRPGSWIIPVLIGVVFLSEDLFFDFNLRPYYWPIILIGIGLAIILRRAFPPMGNSWKNSTDNWSIPYDTTSDSTIRVTSILSGTKESVISKDFKGGEITSVLGGSEINLTQADISTTATIDITNIMGGTVLIIPAHWSVKSDILCILGGVDEKRAVKKDFFDPSKVLRLTGMCLMGGVEIKSY